MTDILNMKKEQLHEIVKTVKTKFPVGTRVELVEMDDDYSYIPIGTKGNVTHIDDMATIHVKWDNGSSLGVVYGIDRIKRVN